MNPDKCVREKRPCYTYKSESTYIGSGKEATEMDLES